MRVFRCITRILMRIILCERSFISNFRNYFRMTARIFLFKHLEEHFLYNQLIIYGDILKI